MTSSAWQNDTPMALEAQCLTWASPAGALAMYYAHDSGQTPNALLPPMLLVHSVNASGSAAEMAPLFAHYRASRPVYALDLPGFGQSERTDRVYSPRLMTDAVIAALQTIQQRHGGNAPDVVALSLSSEFAARAQVEHPALIQRLALISPTGLSGKPRRYGAPLSTLGQPWLHRLLSNPGWANGLYRALTRPSVIRYFLERTWGSKSVDETLWRFDIYTTRVTGARFAPLYFLSAHLFSADINTVYESVSSRVWVSMATRGDFTDYRGRSALKSHTNWEFHTVEGGALPYFEDCTAFARQLDLFLAISAPGQTA